MDCSPGQKKGGRCREVVVILVEVRLYLQDETNSVRRYTLN